MTVIKNHFSISLCHRESIVKIFILPLISQTSFMSMHINVCHIKFNFSNNSATKGCGGRGFFIKCKISIKIAVKDISYVCLFHDDYGFATCSSFSCMISFPSPYACVKIRGQTTPIKIRIKKQKKL